MIYINLNKETEEVEFEANLKDLNTSEKMLEIGMLLVNIKTICDKVDENLFNYMVEMVESACEYGGAKTMIMEESEE